MDTVRNDIKCTNCSSSNTRLFANAGDIEYFTSAHIYQYYLCNACEVLFIFPQPSNELQKIYPDNYYSFNDDSKSFSFKIKNKLDRLFFKKHLRELSQQKINVLDIGGGTGSACDVIKKADDRVAQTQIVDIDPVPGKIAMQKGHQYFCGRIEEFETELQYDVILMLNLVEHVADPAGVLKKAKRLLSPGGIIFIQTPNYQSLDAKLFRHESWGGYHCPRHWIIFNKKSFFKLAESCRLKPLHFSYTQGAAFWTVSILHKLHQWKFIKAGAKKPLVYHPLFGITSMIMAAFDFIRKPFAPLSQMLIILKQDEKINS